MILVEHHGDFAITGAEHNFNMKPYQSFQPFDRIGDAAHGTEHALLRDLHGVIHDLEEDLVFALEVVIETAFAELESSGDVVHGGGVIAALLEEASGGAEDFLAGIDESLAGHRVSW